MFYNNTEISTQLHTGAVFCIFGRKVELVLPEAVKSCPVYMRKSGYLLPGVGWGDIPQVLHYLVWISSIRNMLYPYTCGHLSHVIINTT